MRQEDVNQFAWEKIFEDRFGNMLETTIRVYAIYFLGAALLVSAPSYGAEVTGAPYVERLSRVFIGVPNQLPPGAPGRVDSSDAGCREQPPHIDAANNVESPKSLSDKDGGAAEPSVHATIREVQTKTGLAPVVNAEPVHPF